MQASVIGSAVLATLVVARPGRAAVQATDSWKTAATGYWYTPASWSLGVEPKNTASTTYDVVIGATGAAYTVSEGDPSPITLKSLTVNSANATVILGQALAVPVLTVNAGSVEAGGTLTGTTVNAAAGTFHLLSGSYDGVTFNTVALADINGVGAFTDGLTLGVGGGITLPTTTAVGNVPTDITFSGTQTLSGSGTITVGQFARVRPQDGTLTIAPGITVKDVSNTTYVGSQYGSLVNQGTVWAAGGTVAMDGAWQNQGVLRADAGSTLTLGGQFTTAGAGTIHAAGATVVIDGNVDDTGSTFAVNADTGNVQLNSVYVGSGQYATGNISGGTLVVSPGQTFSANGGDLENVAVSGTVVATNLLVHNLTLLPGSVISDRGYVELAVPGTSTGTETVAGTGTISLDGGRLQDYNEPVVLGPGVSVVSGTGVASTVSITNGFVNQGTIWANKAGHTILVNPTTNTGFAPSPWTNVGLVRATNGGTVDAYGQPATAALTGGTWEADAGSTVNIGGLAVYGGFITYTDNAATVVLDGVGSTFPAFAPLARNDGTLALRDGRTFTATAAFVNAGDLSLDATGRFTATGTLTEGSGAEFDTVLGNGSAGSLTATADVLLDGTLSVQLAAGYVPPVGAAYSLVTSGTGVSGTFAAVTLPTPPAGELFRLVYLPASVQVQVTAVPEPTTVWAGAVGLAALAGRRRRPRRRGSR